jgi:hypothetical protein
MLFLNPSMKTHSSLCVCVYMYVYVQVSVHKSIVAMMSNGLGETACKFPMCTLTTFPEFLAAAEACSFSVTRLFMNKSNKLRIFTLRSGERYICLLRPGVFVYVCCVPLLLSSFFHGGHVASTDTLF